MHRSKIAVTVVLMMLIVVGVAALANSTNNKAVWNNSEITLRAYFEGDLLIRFETEQNSGVYRSVLSAFVLAIPDATPGKCRLEKQANSDLFIFHAPQSGVKGDCLPFR